MPYDNYSSQTIFLSGKGCITTSNDNLFSTKILKHQNALYTFPFLEGIFQSLSLQPTGHVFHFKKVKTIHAFLPGIYDYSFTKFRSCKTCKDFLIWTIIDKTIPYNELLIQQQQYQERIIKSKL